MVYIYIMYYICLTLNKTNTYIDILYACGGAASGGGGAAGGFGTATAATTPIIVVPSGHVQGHMWVRIVSMLRDASGFRDP